jgi:hypothetical protein
LLLTIVGQVPPELIDECNVVGACKLSDYEPMFLFHFYEWKGHEDEYRWMTLSEAKDISSLTDAAEAQKLVGETLHVYWTETATVTSTPYQGRISQYEKDEMVHHIEYEDDDCEYLNLSTLQVSSVQNKPPPKHQREAWLLDGSNFSKLSHCVLTCAVL